MNLTANFLYPSEMRSASMVSLKSMVKFSAVLIPAIVVIVILYEHVKLEESLSALAMEEARWAEVEKQKERSEMLLRELRSINNSAGELTGWQRSRLDWHTLLDGLRLHVPPAIQLKVMNVRHAIELDAKGQLQRLIKLTLNGRCTGPDADTKVQGFRQQLGEQPPFDIVASNVVVSGLIEDQEPGAREGDRVFEIEMDFSPRNLNEIAGR